MAERARAAYPKKTVPYTKLTAAYVAGGLNSFIPARVGDAVKIFLAKKSIRGSTYPTITSSFFVQTVFDTSAGIIVFIYAITQGLLPEPPELPDIPAFEISFWAQNPQLLIFVVTALAISVIVLFAVLARRAEEFWDRIKQGVVVLRDIPLYLRTVASWQGAAWLLRFFSFFFFLEAFNIGGTVENVLTVMSVQAITGLLPLTPGGAGAQQALLVATLVGPGPDRRTHLLGRPADRDRDVDRHPRLHRDRVRLQDDRRRGLIRSAEADAESNPKRVAAQPAAPGIRQRHGGSSPLGNRAWFRPGASRAARAQARPRR